ncbi:MAG: PaaX family transcriptional regulator [Acidimicrobiales bacterium]
MTPKVCSVPTGAWGAPGSGVTPGNRASGIGRPQQGTGPGPSLLLTILGEEVMPRGGAVWTTVLVEALAQLGVEEKASRQAVRRAATKGLLEAERHGRRTAWRLTPTGGDLLREGAARIYGFMRRSREWDGRWLVVAVTVPEPERQLRHRLRTRLSWAGLGSPLPGLWVTPDVGKGDEVLGVVESLGAEAWVWTGPAAGSGRPADLVGQAWDLEGVRHRYEAFLAAFGRLEVETPAQAFAAQVQLVQEWRRFPFLDPDLPDALLPGGWPGRAAADLFDRRHREWRAGTEEFWGSLVERAAAAGRRPGGSGRLAASARELGAGG